MVCGHRFSGGRKATAEEIWEMYLQGKQTVSQISALTELSASTIKRQLATIKLGWAQPVVCGEGVLHLDATYFGRNTSVLLALESGSGRLLYMKQSPSLQISLIVAKVHTLGNCP